nr:ribonuclease H-like domain-containing protein [Tanacetum cinerariifolium]
MTSVYEVDLGEVVYTTLLRLVYEVFCIRETSVANNTSGLVPQRQKASDYDNPDPVPQRQVVSSLADADAPSQQELNLIFGPLYDEFFNKVLFLQRIFRLHQHLQLIQMCMPRKTIMIKQKMENTYRMMNLPILFMHRYKKKLSSSNNVEQVHGNPSRPVQTRRQIATDPEMCMFALIVSMAEPKNIKEAMADFAWIEAMQEELHQFDRLQIWELHTSLNVAQPDGFVDPNHPEKVYRLKKALYGLKQAPRAWFDELSKFLTLKGFTKGLQIHQSLSGIFINQAKYTLEILHKHGMDKGQSIGTPMATKPKLDADLSGNPVDQTDYHSKIGSLMYLTSSRPDIVQAVCSCARYQSRSTKKHLNEVKRIFRYLKGTVHMGLWYPKDSSFELTAFSDVDHAGCIDTRKSTYGGIQFLGDKLVNWMSKKQNCTAMSLAEAKYVVLSASCAQVMWMRTQL